MSANCYWYTWTPQWVFLGFAVNFFAHDYDICNSWHNFSSLYKVCVGDMVHVCGSDHLASACYLIVSYICAVFTVYQCVLYMHTIYNYLFVQCLFTCIIYLPVPCLFTCTHAVPTGWSLQTVARQKMTPWFSTLKINHTVKLVTLLLYFLDHPVFMLRVQFICPCLHAH